MATKSLTVTYKPRPYISPDINIFANSLKTIDERHEKALSNRSSIGLKLAEVQLNAQEDEWKANYVKSVYDQIDQNVKYGDYSRALSDSIRMADEAFSNPALLGRIRAQKDYQDYTTKLDARTDINDLTKERFKELNPYHYEDKVDKDGKVVGGTKWTPNSNPVKDVDMNNVYQLALKYAAVDAGGGENIAYVDANGKASSTYSPGAVLSRKTGNTWKALSADKVKQAINAVIQGNPEIKAAIQQGYDNLKWAYEKGKIGFKDNDIVNADGNYLTTDQYINNMFSTFADTVKYKHVYSTINEAETAFGRASAVGSGGVGAAGKPTDNSDLKITEGPAIKADTSKYISNLGNSINSSWYKLKSLANIPGLKMMISDKVKDDAVKNPDGLFKTIVEQINSSGLSDAEKNSRLAAVKSVYVNFKNDADTYRTFMSSANGTQKQAIAFNNALENSSGIKALAEQGNTFAKSYIKSKEKFLGKDGKFIEFSNMSKEEFDTVIENLGLSPSQYANAGIKVQFGEDGKRSITVDKDYDATIQKLVELVPSAENKLGRLFFNGINVNIIDSKGNKTRRPLNFDIGDILINKTHPYFYGYEAATNSFTTAFNVNSAKDTQNAFINSSALNIGNPLSSLSLYNNEAEYDAKAKAQAKAILTNSNAWIASADMYGSAKGKSGVMEKLSSKDRNEYGNMIMTALNDLENYEVSFINAHNKVSNRTGTLITLTNKKDANDIQKFYVDRAIVDSEKLKFERDTANQAKKTLSNATIFNKPIVVGDPNSQLYGQLTPYGENYIYSDASGSQVVLPFDKAVSVAEINHYVNDAVSAYYRVGTQDAFNNCIALIANSISKAGISHNATEASSIAKQLFLAKYNEIENIQ